jgi:hypothetical protein
MEAKRTFRKERRERERGGLNNTLFFFLFDAGTSKEHHLSLVIKHTGH